MFEDNNIDEMMKSILENGQEEVPAHIWEGVSSGLDKAARHKKVVLWWRAGAIAAAAAAVALVLVLNRNQDTGATDTSAMGDEPLIAVVEKEDSKTTDPKDVLIAEVPEIEKPASHTYRRTSAAEALNMSAVDETGKDDEMSTGGSESKVGGNETDSNDGTAVESKPESEKEPEKISEPVKDGVFHEDFDWEEDEEDVKRNRIRTSMVLSGITGTNSEQSKQRASIMKRPTLTSGPAKTGITETSTNTTYGIPLSFGAGVKIDFTPKWSVGIGANYSHLTRKFYGTYTKADENGVEESSTSSDIKNTQHFVGIPVNVYYNIVESKNLNFYAYLGGTAEKCISDKYELLNTSIVHKEVTDGLQLSANAGIGVEFMVGKHLGLYIDPSVRYYFDNNQPKSIRTAQPLMFGCEMGLRVRL